MKDVLVRCPVNTARVFMRLKVTPEVRIVEGNLIEVDCRDCRKQMGARRVLHRYNPVGDLVETEVLE